MEGRLKPQRVSESSVRPTSPERTQEFLDEISDFGDPAMVAEMLEVQTAKATDRGADIGMILPKGNFQAGEGAPYPHQIRNKVERLKALFSGEILPEPTTPRPRFPSASEVQDQAEEYFRNHPMPKNKVRVMRDDERNPDKKRRLKTGVPITLNR